MKKDNGIYLRCTYFEKEFIKKKAKLKNYTKVSEFILNSLIYPEKLDVKKMKDMVYEVNKIGVNLNQAVRKMHSDNEINEELIEAIKETNLRLEMVLNTFKKL